jgi:hypothetical protein
MWEFLIGRNFKLKFQSKNYLKLEGFISPWTPVNVGDGRLILKKWYKSGPISLFLSYIRNPTYLKFPFFLSSILPPFPAVTARVQGTVFRSGKFLPRPASIFHLQWTKYICIGRRSPAICIASSFDKTQSRYWAKIPSGPIRSAKCQALDGLLCLS